MLIYLFLFLSFTQMGLFGLGGSLGTQALLEHDLITLHKWLTPAQMADLMVFCRALPGGTGINAATLTGYLAAASRMGFWGCTFASLISLVSLALPSALWTYLFSLWQKNQSYKHLLDCALVLLRPLVPGLIAAAAILLMRPDTMGSPALNPWQFGVSIFLFVATLIGTLLYRFNGGFMIILAGIAGWILF